jgi:hypothetical protein
MALLAAEDEEDHTLAVGVAGGLGRERGIRFNVLPNLSSYIRLCQ